MNVPGAKSSAALELRRIEERYRTIRTLIRVAGAALVGYFAFDCLKEMAGQSTAVDIAVSFALHVLAKAELVVAVGLTGGATVWAIAERTLRRRKTEYMQGRIRELEQRLDPNRTTSGLTPKGKTNPKDIRR